MKARHLIPYIPVIGFFYVTGSLVKFVMSDRIAKQSWVYFVFGNVFNYFATAIVQAFSLIGIIKLFCKS